MRRAGWPTRPTGWRDGGASSPRRGADAGAAMDPAGTAELLRETRGLARPAGWRWRRPGWSWPPRPWPCRSASCWRSSCSAPTSGAVAGCWRSSHWRRSCRCRCTRRPGSALGNAGRMQALGVRPILVGRFGAAVVHAMAALPWVVLLAGVGLCAVEPELEESALLEFGPLARADADHDAAGDRRDRGGRAGGRRADRRRHDRHRPAPGPHVCRGGLRPVHPGRGPGRRGRRRAAAAARAGVRDRPGRPGAVAPRPGAAGVGVFRGPDVPARTHGGSRRACCWPCSWATCWPSPCTA